MKPDTGRMPTQLIMAAASGAIILFSEAHWAHQARTEFPGLLTTKTLCVSMVISVLLFRFTAPSKKSRLPSRNGVNMASPLKALKSALNTSAYGADYAVSGT